MRSRNRIPDQSGMSPPTERPFRVRSRGRNSRNPYHSTRGTHHGDIMLTLVLEGRGIYQRGSKSIVVGQGMVGLVHPGDDPGLLFADPADPYDHLYCRFSGGEAAKIARRISTRYRNRAFFDFPGWKQLAEVFHALLRCPGGSDNDDELAPCDAMLGYLLTLIDHYDQSQPDDGLSAENLVGYLGDHLSEPADLSKVARHFGISKEHLCRCARPLLGMTVHQKWLSLKMDWAMILLLDSSLAIKDVARRVGYHSPLYFSNAFRKHCGMSPTAFRNQGRQ